MMLFISSIDECIEARAETKIKPFDIKLFIYAFDQSKMHFPIKCFNSALLESGSQINCGLGRVGNLEGVPFIEHTSAYAQWAHMHRFLSVCLSVRYFTKIQTRQ